MIRTVMTKKFCVKGTLGVVAAAATMSVPTHAWADDVYNFYFQKGGAPQSVVQSGRGQNVTTDSLSEAPIRRGPPERIEEHEYVPETKTETRIESSISTQVREKAIPGHKKFQVGFGLYRVADAISSQLAYSLTGQLNFNRFLGVRLQGHFMQPEEDRAELNVNPDQTENRYGGMASVVFTPIQIQLVGHQLLDFSAHAGVMSERVLGDVEPGTRTREIELAGRGFIGASTTLAVNDNVGVEAFASLLEGGELGRVGGSMVFRF